MGFVCASARAAAIFVCHRALRALFATTPTAKNDYLVIEKQRKNRIGLSILHV